MFTILFDIVFELLLDFLKPLNDKGYPFRKAKGVCLHTSAYADDLTLVTDNPDKNQQALDRTDQWLKWTKTMAAKPRKCVSMAMKQFDKRRKTEDKFKPLKPGLSYSSFDPQLNIGGHAIKFLFDPLTADPFDNCHFKFLGRFIHVELSEAGVKAKMKQRFEADMELISKSLINGFMKLWLYQFYVLARLSWCFLVHDLDRSFAVGLSVPAIAKLKSWTGIYRTAENGVLFRSKSNFGLGLTDIVDHFERLQLVKCQLLSRSPCANIRSIYEAKAIRESGPGRKWRSTQANSEAEAIVHLKLRFQTQSGRQGLGAGNFVANPSKRLCRKLVSATSLSLSQEKRVAHSAQLARQGAWSKWADRTEPFDFSWRNLIYKVSPHVIKFVIHAAINWVKTPDLMSLWGKYSSSKCFLCGHPICSITHILSGCKTARNEKRYNWRHDSVLYTLELTLRPFIENFNNSRSSVIPVISRSFVPSGEASPSTGPRKKSPKSCLDGARDWELLVDYDHKKIVFPPEIYATPERPDIIIWSRSTKVVYLPELTCPSEENITNANNFKTGKYDKLVSAIDKSWTVLLLPFEVGARGFVALSTRSLLTKLGFSSRVKSSLVKSMSLVSARCSYTIFLSHSSVEWNTKRALLEPDVAVRISTSSTPPSPSLPTITSASSTSCPSHPPPAATPSSSPSSQPPVSFASSPPEPLRLRPSKKRVLHLPSRPVRRRRRLKRSSRFRPLFPIKEESCYEGDGLIIQPLPVPVAGQTE